MKTLLWSVLLVMAVMTVGCRKHVDAGQVGMCRTPAGFVGDVLAPGRHSCWGDDVMHYMEVTDKQSTLELQILCADQVNFKFQLGIRSAVDKSKTALIKQVFENTKAAGGTTITAKQLYEMYVRPIVDETTRLVVSRYKTTEIIANRAKLVQELRAAIDAVMKDTLMVVKQVTFQNEGLPAVRHAGAGAPRRHRGGDPDREGQCAARVYQRAEQAAAG